MNQLSKLSKFMRRMTNSQNSNNGGGLQEDDSIAEAEG